ncbi:hypothetical protein Fot_03927 [Forsythia ovata]|uniref:Uncharacterized protein n=1 Tax=Forsythia ovata TaxID=205694 RepID=A0ABD1XE61_9LAMI
MVNAQESWKTESSEEPKEENENGGGKGMVEYEESKAQIIKENMYRMKSLGILNLSKKLKPESRRQIAKTLSHKKKPARDDPPRELYGPYTTHSPLENLVYRSTPLCTHPRAENKFNTQPIEIS